MLYVVLHRAGIKAINKLLCLLFEVYFKMFSVHLRLTRAITRSFHG